MDEMGCVYVCSVLIILLQAAQRAMAAPVLLLQIYPFPVLGGVPAIVGVPYLLLPKSAKEERTMERKNKGDKGKVHSRVGPALPPLPPRPNAPPTGVGESGRPRMDGMGCAVLTGEGL